MMIKIVAPALADMQVVETVQRSLLELGYPSAGVVDGDFGWETQGAVLDFMNRNHLAPPPVIDDALLEALKNAPKKARPPSVSQATVSEITPKVAAVNKNSWAKFVAKISAIPAGLATLILGTVSGLGDAIDKLAPLKAFLSEYLGSINPIVMAVSATGIVTVLSFVTWWQTRGAEAALKDGYQRGTVKDDNTREIGAPAVLREEDRP